MCRVLFQPVGRRVPDAAAGKTGTYFATPQFRESVTEHLVNGHVFPGTG